jgi:hypothetical protein
VDQVALAWASSPSRNDEINQLPFPHRWGGSAGLVARLHQTTFFFTIRAPHQLGQPRLGCLSADMGFVHRPILRPGHGHFWRSWRLDWPSQPTNVRGRLPTQGSSVDVTRGDDGASSFQMPLFGWSFQWRRAAAQLQIGKLAGCRCPLFKQFRPSTCGFLPFMLPLLCRPRAAGPLAANRSRLMIFSFTASRGLQYYDRAQTD